MIIMIKLQDEPPWTRIILPQACSPLEGQSGISDRDKMPTHLGITQKIVNSILFP